MSQFTINIDSNLNLSKAKVDIESFISKYQSKPINLNVRVNTNSMNGVSKQIQNSFTNVTKNANTALQRQIEAMARTQRNAFSRPLVNMDKYEKSYSDWWNKALSQKEFTQMDATVASNRTLLWLKNNSKAAKDYGTRLKELAELQRTASDATSLRNYTKQVNVLKSEATALGKIGKSFTNELARSFKVVGQFALTYGVIHRIPMLLKQMATEVLNVDTAMTELRKVSDASASELETYFTSATSMAKEYGRTISDIIQSTADWSRLGYNLYDSKELARVTALYQNVGDGITQEQASESLISTLQGYELTANEAENIVNKFNEVGNNFAISSAGIGEALKRSAASFHAANTDLSKSIALITGTNEVVQNPDVVGNMWKTVAMRIRSTKQELEMAGEDTDGMVESTSQLRGLIQGLTGFDIMADEAGTQFKDIYDIVVGIGEKWDELNDIDQAGLLEALAGKRQGNALAAALNNIDTIKEVYQTAEFGSDGSAMAEQAKYAESLGFKLEKLKATTQEFSGVVFDPNFLKGAVDGATGFLEIITKIIDEVGMLPILFSSIGAVSLFKNRD